MVRKGALVIRVARVANALYISKKSLNFYRHLMFQSNAEKDNKLLTFNANEPMYCPTDTDRFYVD